MADFEATLPAIKKIALIAHDNRKDELLSWAQTNRERLSRHELFATGTTGRLLQEKLGLPITRFHSGPLGGDQQVGARIAEGEIHVIIFFWDPLDSHPHDPDVKALLRMAVVWNIPSASNSSSADFLINSPLFDQPYERHLPDIIAYQQRSLPNVDHN